MRSTLNRGRRVGVLYLLVSIPGAFALMYVPSKVVVHGNPLATVHNIAAFETLFRLGIATNLIAEPLFILVALALYELLKEVNQRRAVLMVTLIAVSIPIACMNELNAIASLVLVHGAGISSTFDQPQRDALAAFFITLHSHGFDVASIFWGLWLFPLGLLVYRSGFFPRVLGILLIAHCFAYVANSLTSIVLPNYESVVSRWTRPFQFGELAFMAWLLVMGATPTPSASPASAAAA